MNESKRLKIKIKQLKNEILSLNKRLKKNNHSFKKLFLSNEISINIISKEKHIFNSNKKQIKEYNDNSKSNNYNTIIIKEKKEKIHKSPIINKDNIFARFRKIFFFFIK